jgi:hypothetical protein
MFPTVLHALTLVAQGLGQVPSAQGFNDEEAGCEEVLLQQYRFDAFGQFLSMGRVVFSGLNRLSSVCDDSRRLGI